MAASDISPRYSSTWIDLMSIDLSIGSLCAPSVNPSPLSEIALPFAQIFARPSLNWGKAQDRHAAMSAKGSTSRS